MTEQEGQRNGRLSGIWFAWAWVLPQLVLLWLNLRAWVLVRGDLSDTQRAIAMQLGLFEATLLICGLVGLAGWIIRRQNIGPWYAAGALVLHVSYLWFFLDNMDQLIPSAVSLWMLPETEIMFYQFSLIMPVIFLVLVGLARVETGLSRGADIGISFGLLVGIPVAAYIVGMVLSRLTRAFSFSWNGFQYLLIFGLIVATALVLVAFLKLLLRLHGAISCQRWSEWVLPLAAGLAAPLGGLALNSGIPFPYDFQDVTVYVLTVLNGVALLIPFRAESRLSTAGWIARAIFFPFSLYFFLVFLPFFPLSLLAMIAAGAGVLILAPIFLLVIHGKLLMEQGRTLVQWYGLRRVVVLCAACLLVIPAVFLARCENDRRTLGRAVDTVFSPDYRTKSVGINTHRLSRALRHMEDVKNGIFLPYLTDTYSALVFRGLVLPDAKVDLIRRSLLGEAPLGRSDSSLWGRGFLGGGFQGTRTTRGAGVTHDVKMGVPEVTGRATNDVMEVEVRLALENGNRNNGEFVAPVTVPEGVLVSGFWIDVNGTNKWAQLREKKTAIWVYEMIRDMTRRDPGLFIYKDDNCLMLRVYPFDSGQRRRCGITFRFPAALQPVIRIQDTQVALCTAEGTEPPSSIMVSTSGSEALVVPQSAKKGLPQFVRPLAAHIILDRSATASVTVVQSVLLAKDVISSLPVSVQDIQVTWANYEQEDMPGSAKTREAALAMLGLPVTLPYQGGFCPERVMARILLAERDKAAGGATLSASSAPVFVIVPSVGSSAVKLGGLEAFARLVPDMPAYIVCSSGTWQRVSFEDGSTQTKLPGTLESAPVIAVRKGKALELLPAAGDSGMVIVPAGAGQGEWECWDPVQNAFRSIGQAARCADPVYGAGVDLWGRHRALGLEPRRIDMELPGIVAKARETGIMVPETAFVVVETTAQEVTLARKEQQALSANHALEFDNAKPAPAPSVLWGVPLVLFFLFRLRRKSRNSA